MPVYVIQVAAGNEAHAARSIDRAMLDLQTPCESFVPLYQTMKHYQGDWHPEHRQLFPGYVFARTHDVASLRKALRCFSGPKKILGTEQGPLPLTEEETAWIHKLMGNNTQTHTVGMSVGVIVGDEIQVQQGPLKGHEAIIKKIDRHRRLALVELSMLGRKTTVRVGLEIVAKYPSAEQAEVP